MDSLSRIRRALRQLQLCISAYEDALAEQLAKGDACGSKRRKVTTDEAEWDRRDSLPFMVHTTKAHNSKRGVQKKYGAARASPALSCSSSSSALSMSASSVNNLKYDIDTSPDTGMTAYRLPLVDKAKAVERAYSQAVMNEPSLRRGGARRSSSLVTLPTKTRDDVAPSLQAITAFEIGYGIEQAVDDALEQSQLPTQDCDCDPDEDEYCDDCAKLSKGELEDTRARMIDEWYESVPDHARPMTLAGHATALVCKQVTDPCLFKGLISNALARHARLELAKLSPVLCRRSFDPRLNDLWTLERLVSESLHHPARGLGQSQLIKMVRTTQNAILESTFDERYFFSPFVRIERDSTDAAASTVVYELLVSVVDRMMSAFEADGITASSTHDQVGTRLLNDLKNVLVVCGRDATTAPEGLGEVVEQTLVLVERYRALDDSFNQDALVLLEEALLRTGDAGPTRERLLKLVKRHESFVVAATVDDSDEEATARIESVRHNNRVGGTQKQGRARSILGPSQWRNNRHERSFADDSIDDIDLLS